MTLTDSYEAILWGMMDWLGITDSLRRKMLAAVALQFSAAVGLFVLPILLTGTVLRVAQGAIFLGAIVAFVNTLLIVQKDLIDPLNEIEAAAGRIAEGHVDTEQVTVEQPDEVGSLANSFAGLQSYLMTVSAQADALAEQNFEDPALEKPVPGPFGESLARMAENLETHTHELEARSARLRRLVDAFETSTGRAIDGDLTATIDPDAIDDPEGTYSVVVDRYNELLRTLQTSLSETANFAAEVRASTDQVVDSTTELDQAGTEIAGATDEIAAGADNQREKLQTAVSEVNTLSATVEEIAASSEEVSRTAETASEAAMTGKQEATETADELSTIEGEISEVADSVDALVARIDEVDEIVTVITEIAEQTNLLALNASIEAARVSNGGEGFAVVADEVKSLAEETRSAADDIGDRLDAIQDQSDETIADVESARDRVRESTDSVERSLGHFDDIAAVVTEVSDSVHEISSATDQQAESAEDVAAVVDDVASISDSTAADAADAAAAAEEQTASISSVANTVSELASEAGELEALLDSFELEDDGTHAVTAASTDAREQPAAEASTDWTDMAEETTPQQAADEFDWATDQRDENEDSESHSEHAGSDRPLVVSTD